MPKDAKIGLVAGLGFVLGVAVMFYRKDTGPLNPGAGEAFSARIQATVPPTAPRGVYRPARSQTVTPMEAGNLDEPREITAAEGRGWNDERLMNAERMSKP